MKSSVIDFIIDALIAIRDALIAIEDFDREASVIREESLFVDLDNNYN